MKLHESTGKKSTKDKNHENNLKIEITEVQWLTAILLITPINIIQKFCITLCLINHLGQLIGKSSLNFMFLKLSNSQLIRLGVLIAIVTILK